MALKARQRFEAIEDLRDKKEAPHVVPSKLLPFNPQELRMCQPKQVEENFHASIGSQIIERQRSNKKIFNLYHEASPNLEALFIDQTSPSKKLDSPTITACFLLIRFFAKWDVNKAIIEHKHVNKRLEVNIELLIDSISNEMLPPLKETLLHIRKKYGVTPANFILKKRTSSYVLLLNIRKTEKILPKKIIKNHRRRMENEA